MTNRYHAVLQTWNGRNGTWSPSVLGRFKTRERAERRLAKVVRLYTRYERRVDFGEVLDAKTGRTTETTLDVVHVLTVGDLGWW